LVEIELSIFEEKVVCLPQMIVLVSDAFTIIMGKTTQISHYRHVGV
jgi:hypothetical protein